MSGEEFDLDLQRWLYLMCARPSGSSQQGATPITITAAVLTFIDHDNLTLALTLSSAPGDVGPLTAGSFTLHAAGRTWICSEGTYSVIGTTLTITNPGIDSYDSNYNSAQDLVGYDGLDSVNLPNVSAVTNLPVTFTGGALAVPSGTWTISGDFASDAGQVDGSFSRACTDIETEDAGTFSGETGSHAMAFAVNPATIAISGSTFQAVFISNGAAHVAAAQFAYTGTSNAFLDSLSRPIPPFIKALSP